MHTNILVYYIYTYICVILNTCVYLLLLRPRTNNVIVSYLVLQLVRNTISSTRELARVRVVVRILWILQYSYQILILTKDFASSLSPRRRIQASRPDQESYRTLLTTRVRVSIHAEPEYITYTTLVQYKQYEQYTEIEISYICIRIYEYSIVLYERVSMISIRVRASEVGPRWCLTMRIFMIMAVAYESYAEVTLLTTSQ